jgi:Spy/CpxP family protein refolding chaperone
MRKSTYLHGLGLALLVGTGVAVSSAQPPAGNRPSAGAVDTNQRGRGERGDRRGQGGPEGRRGPGGRSAEGLLLRGITLSEAQQKQVATLREQQRERMRAQREQLGATRGDRSGAQNGALRQRPDSATLAARRKQFQEQRQRDEAALRAILTPEQRKQFDANRAELEKRFQERQAQGAPGAGRGPRAEWRGRQG